MKRPTELDSLVKTRWSHFSEVHYIKLLNEYIDYLESKHGISDENEDINITK